MSAIASTPDGKGYWEVGENGSVYAFGDAGFYGSGINLNVNGPVVSIQATPDGKGYILITSNGGVYTFGDATFKGAAS